MWVSLAKCRGCSMPADIEEVSMSNLASLIMAMVTTRIIKVIRNLIKDITKKYKEVRQ